MAGRLDKPLPFCLFLRAFALRERSENCRAVPDPKSACSSKKLDRQSNSTEAIARRRPHASVSRASQAGENNAPAELALACFVLFPRNLLTVRRGKKGVKSAERPMGRILFVRIAAVRKLSGLSILSEHWLSFFHALRAGLPLSAPADKTEMPVQSAPSSREKIPVGCDRASSPVSAPRLADVFRRCAV